MADPTEQPDALTPLNAETPASFQKPPPEEAQEELKSEVPYESLVITLKEQNAKLKKMETLKAKLEERYKDKTKEVKRLVREKQVAEDFIRQVLGARAVLNQEGQMELEQLLKLHSELYEKHKSLGAKEVDQLLKEENDTLKKKVMDLSNGLKQEQSKNQALQQNALNLKLKEAEKRIKGLEQLLREKDDQVESLRQITAEYAELKGKQLLQVIKAGKSQEVVQVGVDEEEIQQLKQQLSEKTNKILELQEKLTFANQTVQALAETQDLEEVKHSASDQRKSESKEDSQLDLSYDEATVLKIRLAEAEQQRAELVDAVEQNKAKARALLVQKDTQIQRLKMVCAKYESHLKSSLSAEEVQKIGQLREEELVKLQQFEAQVETEAPEEDRGGRKPSFGQVDDQNIEYIKNVFVKYLEYLAQNNKKEIITIEHVLFTELGLTRDECSRLDHLRRQNTFWKKILPFQGAVQPLVKNKFSAGELKKKLFGGMA